MKTYQSDVTDIESVITSKTGVQDWDPYFLVTSLSSEVGELADELIGVEGGRIEDPNYDDKSELAKEIVDVVFNAIRVANHYGIDFNEHWEKRVQSLMEKFVD